MTAVASKEVTTSQLSAIRFGFYTDDEVRKLSVKQLTQPVLTDSMRNPIPGGLYDTALGPIDKFGRCATCHLGSNECPGHFGHIQLPVPVYNPLIFRMMYRLLRQQCHCCYHLRLDREEVSRFETKLALLCSGRLTDAVAMQVSRSSPNKELGELLEKIHQGNVPQQPSLDGATSGGRITSLTLEAIHDTISELFARIPVGRCRNCDAHSPNIKKQGATRVFKVWNSAKALQHNARMGRTVKSAIAAADQVLEDVEGAMEQQLAEQKALREAKMKERKMNVKKGEYLSEDEDEDEEDTQQGEGETLEDLVAEQEAAREAAMGQPDEPTGKKGKKGNKDVIPADVLKMDMRPKFMSAWEVETMMQRLWEREWKLLALVFGPGGDMWGDPTTKSGGRPGRRKSSMPGMSLRLKAGELHVSFSPEVEKAAKEGWRMFFLRVLPVAPNKFRPASVMGDQMFEHPQNTSLSRILNTCMELRSIQDTMTNNTQLANVVDPAQVKALMLGRMISQWLALQDAVSGLMDSTMAENAPQGTQGIRQALEKKEGLFRMNMMGKRVNFAARSVISPDPYIGTGEIGVPPYFAMRLCYPERVTPWNVDKLRQAVMRGPFQLNGAVAVEDARGRIINLKAIDEKKREGIAKSLLSTTEGSAEVHARLGIKGRLAKAVGGGLGGAGVPAGSGGAFTASNKIVYRHLQDGDLMLTNRQPTLHKPSLMAHRARVLKGEKTIRFHYANCSSFNADFDGDEINLHLPQDHFGRAEGYGIVHADHQFIVPTDGKPIRGLIQDHVVSGVLLTKRDTWLTKAQYSQLVYLACTAWRRAGAVAEGPENLELEPPAILHPRQLWSGKQVITTALKYYTWGRPPLTFNGGSKVPADYWGKTSGEAELIFHKGYMVSGCLDKNTYGKFGLVHAVQELYGGPVAGALLSCFSRLFTAYLQWHGFTCGFDDLLLNQAAEDKRKSILGRAEAIAVRASADFVGLEVPEAVVTEHHKHQAQLNTAASQVRAALSERYRSSRSTGAAHDMKGSGVMHPLSSEVVKACIPAGQIKPFPANCLSLMTVSGAKGSLVNFSQISCLLGQQELEGRRVPRMASGATLPCFAPYDGGARSCGFVGDRFLSGLRPQEYYFHCMAGREGLIDTTVKTSRSGYLQRCLVKNLETLRVHYDYTVRDNADGSIVQFYYGDDGLDVTQVSYMHQLGFLSRNAPRFSQALDLKSAQAAGKTAGVQVQESTVRSILHRRAKNLQKLTAAADKKSKQAELQAKLRAQLPVQAVQPPSVLGATSEAFMDKLLNYLTTNPDNTLSHKLDVKALDKEGKSAKKSEKSEAGVTTDRKKSELVDPEQFLDLLSLKYMRALAAPGEAVGVLAAQSVGEPSTQMTLNTFHMAGRGEANVTLGIPRLREILMTAAPRIKTPVMTLPLLPGMGTTEANVLAGRMRRLRLAECLAGINVQEQPITQNTTQAELGRYGRAYTVTLQFFNPSQYPAEAELSFDELVSVFRGAFCARLRLEVDKEVKRKSGSATRVVIGQVDAAKLGEEEGGARGQQPVGEDEDGDGEVGGSSRGRAKRGHGAGGDDMEAGQDLPEDGGGEEEENEGEREDAAEEGKLRFRGITDDTTYDAPDEEDLEAAQQIDRQARARSPAHDDSDDEADDAIAPAAEDGPQAKADGKKTSKAAQKTAKKTDKAVTGCLLDNGMEGSDDDVDFAAHTCRVTVGLPLRAPKLLMLEIVERVAAAVMVRATESIDKVYVLAGDRGEGARVQTDGVNFDGVWEHADLVDVNGITTNDVAAMLRTYGVEAARATILREVQSVFAAYGIGVDPRHLGLIADFMTQQGGYRACNRIGIESNVSPFLKMSFETAAHFLTDATLRHASDDLRTPSARLCVGQVVELGTGAMGLVQQIAA